MKDIQLLFCIISLFTGVSSITISSFIYYINKKKTLKIFIGLIFSFFCIQNSITLTLYSKYTIEVSSLILLLSKILDIIGTTFNCLLGLIFVNYLFGIKISNIKKIIYIFIFVFQFTGITLYYLNYLHHTVLLILRSSLIFVIVYEITIVLKNYKQVNNAHLKKAIKLFLTITLIFFPFITFEFYRAHIQWVKNIEIFKIFALPSYFFVINIFSLIFAIKYFNTPVFINNNKLTDYFIQKYDITEKESQVIELIIEGLTYKQAAEKLFISPKTVDNHMQNIYKKLNVKSKIQLCNFVRSNEK